jgi:predicted DNA-binding transcriptional regulator YafY
MDEALLAEDLLEFGSEVTVIAPASLAMRIEQALEQVVMSHA